MTLDQEDITAIAAEVVRQLDIRAIAQELHRLLRCMDDVQMDVAHYIRTVPIEERKRRAREQMRRERDAETMAEKARALVDPIFAEQLERKQLAKQRATEAKRAANKAAKAAEKEKVKTRN